MPSNAINTDGEHARAFGARAFTAGYRERYALRSEEDRMADPMDDIESKRSAGAPMWGALALACVGVLMYSGFVTRGNDEIAEIAFGRWPYVIYLLLIICFLNIGLDLWLKVRWLVEHIRARVDKSSALKREAVELSARIPGSDSRKVKQMLRKQGP